MSVTKEAIGEEVNVVRDAIEGLESSTGKRAKQIKLLRKGVTSSEKHLVGVLDEDQAKEFLLLKFWREVRARYPPDCPACVKPGCRPGKKMHLDEPCDVCHGSSIQDVAVQSLSA